MQAAIHVMHEEVVEATTRRNASAKKSVDKNRPVKVVNFEVGDYVLHANTYKTTAVNKLHVIWRGPYRITKVINDLVYEIQDLLQPEKVIPPVHATRLRYYSDKSLDVDETCIITII